MFAEHSASAVKCAHLSSLRGVVRRVPPNAVELAALIVYVAIGVVLLLHHESWCDEADAWLIVRDAPISQIPGILGREGMPPLWDLILLPFARAGFPHLTQSVIHLAIASASAALLLFRAPFNRLLKLLILFSYYLGYEYVVVVRQYALTVLLLFVLAVLFPKRRNERSLWFAIAFALFVASSAHALAIGSVIGPLLAADFILRRSPRRWEAIAIMATGGIVSALPMIFMRHDAVVVPFATFSVSPRATLYAIARAFVPMIGVPVTGAFWTAAWAGVTLLTATVFISACIVLLRDRLVLLMFCAAAAAILFMTAYVYWGGLHHSGLLFIVLIFSLWITGMPYERRWARTTLMAGLYLSLAFSVFFAVRVWRLELLYPYSGSKETATFLMANGLQNRPIAARGQSESVLLYLPPRQFWYPHENRYGSFFLWNASLWKNAAIPVDVAATRALEKFARVPDLLILTNEPLTIAPRYGLRLLYFTRGPVFGKGSERFWLYDRGSATR